MRLLLRWVINTAAILVTAYVLQARLRPRSHALGSACRRTLLGLLNTFVRPVFQLLALPINILTLGLFTLVINAAIVQILSWLMGDAFHVKNFRWAILVALLISVITSIINILWRGQQTRRQAREPPQGRSESRRAPAIGHSRATCRRPRSGRRPEYVCIRSAAGLAG